jgi:hypothetical protein
MSGEVEEVKRIEAAMEEATRSVGEGVNVMWN